MNKYSQNRFTVLGHKSSGYKVTKSLSHSYNTRWHEQVQKQHSCNVLNHPMYNVFLHFIRTLITSAPTRSRLYRNIMDTLFFRWKCLLGFLLSFTSLLFRCVLHRGVCGIQSQQQNIMFQCGETYVNVSCSSKSKNAFYSWWMIFFFFFSSLQPAVMVKAFTANPKQQEDQVCKCD